MEKTGWKTLAIIFIVLFVLETLLFTWLYSWGTEILEKEDMCAYNVCGDDLEIIYYDYLDYEKLCECYDADMNVIKQEYLG